jgi:hypothetical protein
MFMPKTPLSVTLDDANLLWLKGRVAGGKKRSLSEALDQILTEARRGGAGADAARTVVGTIDIAGDDPSLDRADGIVRAIFAESANRPFLVRESVGAHPLPAATPRKTTKAPGSAKRRG